MELRNNKNSKLIKSFLEERSKLIRENVKLNIENKELKKQLSLTGVSCSSDGCYECGGNNLRPKEYNCLDCGHDGYCY